MPPLLLLISSALAAGESADVELFQPRFGDGPVPGVDSPWLRKRTLRIGLYGQYAQNPLVEYRDDGSELPVIGMRIGGDLGFSYDISDRVSVRAGVPLSYQGGGETDGAADGFGLGDVFLGGRVVAYKSKPFQLGVHADLYLPAGAHETWRAEESPRFYGGALLGVKGGPISASADLGVALRAPVETEANFTLGSELVANVGLNAELAPKLFSLGVGAWSRAGFANIFSGGAENSLELLADARLTPTKNFIIDLAAGRGFTEGYGTSDLRVILGLTYKQRFQEEVQTVVEEAKPPPDSYLKEVSDEELEKAIEKEQIGRAHV